MLERLRKHEDSESGFTLIELLIVIVILGVLAAIVVFAIGGTRKDSVTASCKTNVKQVQLSAEAALTKSGHYPSVPAAPGNNYDNLLTGNTDGPSGGDNGALMKSWPVSSDYTFTYARPTTTTYTLTITGTGVTGGTLTQSSDDNAVATACAGK